MSILKEATYLAATDPEYYNNPIGALGDVTGPYKIRLGNNKLY